MIAPARSRPVEAAPRQRTSALRLYDEGLRAVVAGRSHPVQLCDERGWCSPLPLQDWSADSLPGDPALLDRCSGTTLDVGCGPGRLTAALAARTIPALGIDISRTAVALTRRRGGAAVRASVFGPVPAETGWNTVQPAEAGWDTVLLADGNIGIGGDPLTLLRRCNALLATAGRVVVELDAVPVTDVRRVQLRTHARRSEFFDWARVGPSAIAALAEDAGLACQDLAKEDGRWFSVLIRR